MDTPTPTAPTRSPRTLTLGPRADSPAAPVRDVAAAPMPSDHLLQGRRAVEISHNGSVYRLQATKLGKLILTK